MLLCVYLDSSDLIRSSVAFSRASISGRGTICIEAAAKPSTSIVIGPSGFQLLDILAGQVMLSHE